MTSPQGPIPLILSGLAAAAIGSLFAASDAAIGALPEARLQALCGEPRNKAIFGRILDDRQGVLARWLVCRVAAIGSAAVAFDDAANGAQAGALAAMIAVIATIGSYGALAAVAAALGRKRPELVASLALLWLRPLEWAAWPIAAPLGGIARSIANRLPESAGDSPHMTETEVEWIVNQGERAGAIGGEPAEIIRNALDLRETTARAVMVPRRRVTAIDASTPLDKALELVAHEGHTRYPVFQGAIDHVIGYLNAKDLFRVVHDGSLTGRRVDSIVRAPPLVVTETQLVAAILREMRSKRLHMAIVTDEFGGMSGVVTLEDIIEEIVGEIRDEYDTEAQIEETPEGKMLADASVSISDLAAHLKHDIPTDGDFESLGGLLIHKAGRVPEVGATVQIDGLQFIVREADETRVVKVEIVRSGPVAAA
jgi:hypothetical protein